jgi:hypothetical protein
MAFLAVLQARRASKRVERLTESYWEIRYEAAQLRARVARLEGAAADTNAEEPPVQAGSFVPLSTLKRS